MWEWQHVFQGTIESLLKDVLGRLPFEGHHVSFVLGIPISTDTGAICFEPEKNGFVPSDFGTVVPRAARKHAEDPGRNFFIAADHLMARYQASLWPKALREAVLELLREYDTKRNTLSACSFPVHMRDHWVMTVVQLDRQAVDSLYRLQHERQPINPIREFPLQRSLLDAAIHRVLAESEQELRSESRGENIFIADAERVLEDAATSLLSTISMRTRGMGGSMLNLANTISAERYEGAAGRGRMLLAHRAHPDVLARIRLRNPVSITQYRGIRKLLETSSDNMALLSDGEHVWGLGIPKGTYDPSREDLFELRFTAHYKWELLHAGNVMMRVEYRRPRLPVERFDKALFQDHFERIFQHEARSTELLTNAVQAAVEQKHGTLVVITAAASEESSRLAAQSTVIEAEPITREVMGHVSRIDGAVLVAPDGLVYAFGVILDGIASPRGTPTRGARFNSAIRYVDGQQEKQVPCLAIIVSEDGYVDLYPKLRPRVSRSRICALLDALEKHANIAEAFDSEAAWGDLSELDRLRFYLLDKDVDRANAAKESVLKRLKEARAAEVAGTLLGYIIPSVPDFTVSPDMSDDYYLPGD
ncbi:DNA integrity scanning protein DisA nucleotide-binding domain protein [Archangium sp.]|uniref:DNA integrity scanning protein DisA nucleotide-binding domain protein n=1 Tax=Archangium sp. TaxID=1872627 RepID=UPI002EDB1E1A